MNSSLLLQQYPTRLVHLILIVLKIEGRCPYSCIFVGCCFQDLFNIACSILVQFPFRIFSIHLVSVHVLQLYSRIDKTPVKKKLHFILLDKFDFHMINSIHVFANCILMSFSVDETLLPR